MIKIDKSIFKQMVYQNKGKIELLYNGIYKGYHFYILNLGSYPTAYVEIPKGNKYYQTHYDDINVNVHGGLTYSNSYLITSYNTIMENSWFIGWDYAHCNDYIDIPIKLNADGKKWTTEEIIDDCVYVIDQLVESGDKQ